MAGRIKWSTQATKDIEEILSYWNNRNKSSHYSKKLYAQIKQVIKLLKAHPNLGISTTDEHIRMKIFKSYKIFYELESNSITVLRIWNTRQDPKKIDHS